jgi:flagellar hook-length control protein FliK
MDIVNNALAFPNCEAPGAAASDIKPVQDITGSGTGPGFAKELKDCESKVPEANGPKQKTKPQESELKKPESEKEEKGDAKTSDNGMPDNPSAKAVMYGIVGILEGFEPPSYQSDNTACIGIENVAPLSPQPAAQNSAAAQTPLNTQPAAQGNGVAQTPQNGAPAGGGSSELPEQIAWMLQNNEAGTKPVQTQDDILKIVGEYLDSLENTNSQAAGTAPEEPAVNKAVKNGAAAAGPTNTEKTGGAITPEGIRVPERAANPENVLQGGGEEAKALPEQAAKEAKPAAMQTEISPKAAEAEAAGLKPLETGKPETRETSETGIGAAVNVSDTMAFKAEAEQASPVKTELKPESVRESVLKIVDRVKTEASEGKYDFDIDLKPDFMGKVSIKLTMEGGSVKVQIKAEDASVKALLSDQSTNLHTMLKEKGIPVSTVDIGHSGNMTSGREESQGQYDRRNPQGGYKYEPAADGTYESAKEKYDFYLGGSYVEYLA